MELIATLVLLEVFQMVLVSLSKVFLALELDTAAGVIGIFKERKVSELQSYERYNPTFVQDLIVYRGKKFLIHTIKDIWFEEAIETAKARRQFHAGFGSRSEERRVGKEGRSRWSVQHERRE